MHFQTIDGKFLEADNLIAQKRFDEAIIILNEIIQENPTYGKAHNHMGWIYEAKLSDYESAEMHYRLAIQNSPNYHPAYYNYAILLSNCERFDELETILEKASKLAGVDKSKIYNEYAIMYEKKGEFDKAIESYKEYIKNSLATINIDRAKDSIERCKKKMDLLK